MSDPDGAARSRACSAHAATLWLLPTSVPLPFVGADALLILCLLCRICKFGIHRVAVIVAAGERSRTLPRLEGAIPLTCPTMSGTVRHTTTVSPR
jgi:hypothetical protein